MRLPSGEGGSAVLRANCDSSGRKHTETPSNLTRSLVPGTTTPQRRGSSFSNELDWRLQTGSLATPNKSPTSPVLFKLGLHPFRLHKRVMKREATRGDNIHPPRLCRPDTRILFPLSPLWMRLFLLCFFYFYVVDGKQF